MKRQWIEYSSSSFFRSVNISTALISNLIIYTLYYQYIRCEEVGKIFKIIVNFTTPGYCRIFAFPLLRLY
jgi:hypothetical protein